MKYFIEGKNYEIESLTYDGMFINVNGTSITNLSLQALFNGDKEGILINDFCVYADKEEYIFHSFKEAYDFAMNCQKDTALNSFELAAYVRNESKGLGFPLFTINFVNLKLAKEVADKLVDKWTITITDMNNDIECY